LGVGSGGGVKGDRGRESSGRASTSSFPIPSSPTGYDKQKNLPRSPRLQRGRGNADIPPWSVWVEREREKREVRELGLAWPKIKFEFEFFKLDEKVSLR
jgi:hypothetical protein